MGDGGGKGRALMFSHSVRASCTQTRCVSKGDEHHRSSTQTAKVQARVKSKHWHRSAHRNKWQF